MTTSSSQPAHEMAKAYNPAEVEDVIAGSAFLEGATGLNVARLVALRAVTKRVGGRVPVLMDGGIRRGTDVLKALAGGATDRKSTRLNSSH